MNEVRDPFSTWQENKTLLNAIFMKDKIAKYPKQTVDDYFASLQRAHKNVELTRDPFEAGMITDIVSEYLMDMQWNVKQDVADNDFDSQYRFDLVARKEKRTICVLVQPEITRDVLLDIKKDIFDRKKEMPSTRILVATDIMELLYVLQKGSLSDLISDMAQKYKLGMLFVEKNRDYQETWLVPSEFLNLPRPAPESDRVYHNKEYQKKEPRPNNFRRYRN
ncbi:MAG: hypothetical protein KGH76_05440 [Thaumarchaeota archaeon]|nr:hypothetical protein [Nitrososphaerota archaeon]